MFVTDAFAQTRTFYVETLGWRLVDDLEDYLSLAPAGAAHPELAFARTDKLVQFGELPRFRGGVVVSVATADADALSETLRQRGVDVGEGPQDMPWGVRSLVIRDPSGVILDFFHPLPS